jgi:hypothetical protein
MTSVNMIVFLIVLNNDHCAFASNFMVVSVKELVEEALGHLVTMLENFFLHC